MSRNHAISNARCKPGYSRKEITDDIVIARGKRKGPVARGLLVITLREERDWHEANLRKSLATQNRENSSMDHTSGSIALQQALRHDVGAFFCADTGNGSRTTMTSVHDVKKVNIG
jgi:hypothetical protein